MRSIELVGGGDMHRGMWITWERQRRNAGISSALGFSLQEILTSKTGIFRYLLCSMKTLLLLIRSRPSYLAVQNPSIVLALLALACRPFFGYVLAIDAHNAGVFPSRGPVGLLKLAVKLITRHADLTMVTNPNLKKVVESNGGVAFVLPDRIPSVTGLSNATINEQKTVCFICTYAHDEPYQEVLKAAKLLPPDVTILFTGNHHGKVDIFDVPPNVEFLGYLPEENYWATLKKSHLVMDLTTLQDCLVCGAYEAVSLSKPVILSNTAALRNYFFKGCVFVDANAESIAHGITTAFERYQALAMDVANLKEELEKSWSSYLSEIRSYLKLGHSSL